MYIEQLYTNCLAEAAYYVESEGEAVIIDPLRETEPYIALANKRQAKIKYVFETHFHADFVSGHIDLSRKVNAPIVYGPGAQTEYPIYNAAEGEVFSVGKVSLKVLHTPGHTPESSCFLLFDEEGVPNAIFTGDTLFVGDVGRPDLLDGQISSEDLAGMLYDSLNTKIKTLPDNVIVYPAHGPGSACGKNIGKETFSTIGEQKRSNYALANVTREEFIKQITAGILPPPKYFYEDARINKKGYEPIELVIQRNANALSPAQFKQLIHDGALILDTRHADVFERGFIPRSINIGLNGQFAVWVGTLIDIHQKLILVTDPGKEHESVLRLARVGYENVLGYLHGGIQTWDEPLDEIKSVNPNEVRRIIKDGVQLLDVRKPNEWDAGHLQGATFLPLADFPKILESLDKKSVYGVHCGGGYRSMTAISIMKRKGFRNVMNIAGGFSAMKREGIA